MSQTTKSPAAQQQSVEQEATGKSRGLNIHQRMLSVMGKINYVQKENKKVNNQYTFTSIDSVKRAVHTPLVEAGIVVVPRVLKSAKVDTLTMVEMQVDFVNADEPQDLISINTIGYGMDPQDKGPGKAMSYALKYALLQALMLETGDDPEKDVGASLPTQTYKSPATQTATQVAAKVPGAKLKPGGVSQAQIGRLWGIAKTAGYSNEEVHSYVKSAFKYDSVNDLEWKQYNTLCDLMQAKELPLMEAAAKNAWAKGETLPGPEADYV